MANLQLEPLQKTKHDRTTFDCGLDAVNDFLSTQARRQQKQRINRTWVLTDAEMGIPPRPIIGFFTLTQCTVLRAEAPALNSASYPRYPLPALKLAWLGVHRDYQRSARRMGEELLIGALNEAWLIIRSTGLGVAILTDPLTPESDRFFRKYGFEALEKPFGELNTLFLPMRTVQILVEGG